MKTDIKGCSATVAGSEQYEKYQSISGKYYYQYDYRTPGGTLFSCIAKSLKLARQKRDKWLKEKFNEKYLSRI